MQPPTDSVCFIFKRMDVGGAELRTLELTTLFPRTHFTFLTTSRGAGALDEDIRAQGHTVETLGTGLRGIAAAIYHLRRHRPQVVHSQLGIASGFVLFVARVCRVPNRIAHFRSEGLGGRKRLRRTLGLWLSKQLIDRHATNILGVTPHTLSHAWKRDWRNDQRCKVAPNFVDLHRLTKSGPYTEPAGDEPDQPVRLCNIGRDEPTKRREIAIEAWQVFNEQRTAELHLIGGLTADARAALDRVRRSNEGRRVIHRGYVPNAGAALNRMDVTLLTSSREGLPGVVLESLAVGTPVVATELEGVRWISEQTPGIVTVGINAPLSDWASAIEQALKIDRAKVSRAFAHSPFTAEHTRNMYQDIWRGSKADHK